MANKKHEPTAQNAAPAAQDQASGSDHEDSRMKKYDIEEHHPVLGLKIFMALQSLCLFFVVVATPIEMFKLNEQWSATLYPALNGTSQRVCVTAWGMKNRCRSAKYYNRNYTRTFCYRVRVNFKVVEAFCLMTIFFMVFALIAGVISLKQLVGKATVAIMGIVCLFFCTIPWGIISGMYHQKPCCNTYYRNATAQVYSCVGNNTAYLGEMPRFKTMGSYGAGFGLLVTAWAVEVIAIIFAGVPL